MLRYVQGNPLRARLVRRAERWRWSSLGQMGQQAGEDVPLIPICPSPAKRRKDWLDWVNQPQTHAEMLAVSHAIKHNRPYGSAPWTARIEKRLGIGPLRKRGRPSKAIAE